MKKLLHIGCGPKRLKHLPPYFHQGWEEIRLDIDTAVNPDIVASIADMSGVESAAYDGVWSSHNIEHLFHHEAIELLKQLKRVVKADGWAIITCPDIQSAMKHAVEHGLDHPLYQSGMGPISPRDILFGHQASVRNGNEYMGHKNGFDLQSMADIFRQSGFKRFHGATVGYNLWFIGGNFDTSEQALKQLAKATKNS